MKKVNFVQFNKDEEQENIIYMLGSKDAMNIDFEADITINNEELLHDYDMEDVIYALESWQHLYQFTHSTAELIRMLKFVIIDEFKNINFEKEDIEIDVF